MAASNPGAGFEVALTNGYVFPSAQQYDFLLHTTGTTNRILLGYSNNSNDAALIVTSNSVLTPSNATLDARGPAILGDYAATGYFNSNVQLHIRRTNAKGPTAILLDNIAAATGGIGVDAGGMTFALSNTSTGYLFKNAWDGTANVTAGATALMQLSNNGELVCIGDITGFGTISDCNLKTNIAPLPATDALHRVQQLRPVTFAWKDDVFNPAKRGTADVGFLAQQVEAILPLAVGHYQDPNTHDTYKNIKHERLLPYLVAAIQELQREVASLKKQILSTQ